MKKMSLQDLKSLFHEYLGHRKEEGLIAHTEKRGASKPNHQHAHNPSRKPSTGTITPSMYRRMRLGKKPEAK